MRDAVRGLLVKLPKKIRRGELCGDGGTNTGGLDVCVGTSMDADLCEVFAVSRDDDGNSDNFGDVGALDGAEGS